MMKYMFTPLERHSDFGFGVVADAFERAAKSVSEEAKGNLRMHSHFPINYLYRHAIELYLKSCIVNVQRYLNGGTIDIVELKIGSKQRPITNTHSLKTLFEHFRQLVTEHKEKIEIEKKTKWSDIPEDLPGLIEEIEKYDARSTYFRYPGMDTSPIEAEKSSMKEVNPFEVLKKAQSGERVFTFLEVNDDDEVEKAYILDKSVLSECQAVLEKATRHMSGASIGLRMELARGE